MCPSDLAAVLLNHFAMTGAAEMRCRTVQPRCTSPELLPCRKDPAALDQTIDDRQHLPQLPNFARQGIKALLHSQPQFREVFRWLVCSQLVGSKVGLKSFPSSC